MPNTRRRRFSVQHEIAGPPNVKKVVQPRRTELDSELKIISQNIEKSRPDRKTDHLPNSSKITNSTLEIVAEIDSLTSVMTIKDSNNIIKTKDKDVSASKSNIDLLSLMVSVDNSVVSVTPSAPPNNSKKREIRPSKEGSNKREKIPRQHRVKVRSPKRRASQNTDTIECNYIHICKEDKSTDVIAWDEEVEICLENVNIPPRESIEDNRISNHSLEDMCRICHGGEALSTDLGSLISACMCRGTVGRVHVKCLERWLTESGKSRCEICGTRYATRRVHRYGVPRAIVMWLLSQNAKQLMVDSLGIMLMSPLAILAAWLSGRTLSGLMTQDAAVTPWPLASTFVLACMTLVCYYCWIVSAATRHALGWWIWYRAQYEVHLQLQNDDQ